MDDAPKELADGGRSWYSSISLPLVLAFAFLLSFYSGSRGICPLDQSIVFDGGYRVYCGQIPYRDFYIPYGPVTFWIQAALFCLIGVNWYAHALGAAILNVVGTGCSFAIVRSLCRGRSLVPLLAALLTSAWLYAPFGTTYPEQTAFCTMLIGIALVLAAIAPSSSFSKSALRSASLMTMAGCFFIVGVLCKHNAGLPAVGVYVVVILAMQFPEWKRCCANLAFFSFGAAVTSLAFATWLLAYSDPSAFIYNVITIPKDVGAERLAIGGFSRFLTGILSGKGSDELRILAFAWGLLFCLFMGKSLYRRWAWDERRRLEFVAAILGVTLIAFQNLFSIVSSNNGANEKPFLGILFALAFLTYERLAAEFAPSAQTAAEQHSQATLIPGSSMLVLLAVAFGLTLWLRNGVVVSGTILTVLVATGLGCIRWRQPGKPWARLRWRISPQWAAVTLYGLFGYLLYDGVTHSVYRLVQDFGGTSKVPHIFALVSHARFNRSLSAPGLKGLSWGEPTRIGQHVVTADNVEELVTYLKEQQSPFFTFCDFHFLYAALGTPSPQPLLWFHRGLTYPGQYSESLDRQIVKSLRKNGVQTVVMESAAFFGSPRERLFDFPCLKRFITEEFQLDRQIGFFEVYRLRSDVAVASRPPVATDRN